MCPRRCCHCRATGTPRSATSSQIGEEAGLNEAASVGCLVHQRTKLQVSSIFASRVAPRNVFPPGLVAERNGKSGVALYTLTRVSLGIIALCFALAIGASFCRFLRSRPIRRLP